MRIETDDLSGPEVRDLLAAHLADMYATSPAESVHALDLDGLRADGVTFWSAWEGDALVGVGALREIGAGHAEIKSMRTAPEHRGRGVASAVLAHILREARARGYRRVSLETGTQDFFAPARALYEKAGFVPCGPFEGYTDDPNSAFYTLEIAAG